MHNKYVDGLSIEVIFLGTMYNHIPITNEEVWASTLEQWQRDAMEMGDEGVLLSQDVEQKLTGLKRLTGQEENFHCYFMVKNGNIFASSLLEVSHARPESDGAWLKLLNITFRPTLMPHNGKSVEIVKETFEVAIYSIAHVIELIFHEHQSTKLKIYGRTSEMCSYFQVIAGTEKLETVLDTLQLSSKLEGKWLVLEKR